MTLKPTDWPREALGRAQHDLAIFRRELRTARRWNTAYRWLALAGWAVAITALGLRPAEAAESRMLPEGSLACADEIIWENQLQLIGAGIQQLVPGCVFTNQNFRVKVINYNVFSGTEVWVESKGLRIWVDGGALQ